ncbi:hypothetical protein PL221_18670 [Salmonella enterica]|uniref:hypothetical protein n=1 Tax=Salmonella enterica TaxID=28901 RepID=UPI0021D50D0D|nr:hypothetical protein [Salmonella enterica]MCU7097000.1 hypothetical protein [Salmonella enterica]MCU7114701.1 hypothetical protein [Salmonella enterica]MDO3853909.1 hypothetical protein [Salmonella enterica]MDO3917277.1 hypothetical protein [Salmonella enterica]
MSTDKRRYGVFVINPETDSDDPDTMYCNAYLKPLSIFPSTALANDKRRSLVNILNKSNDKRKVVVRTMLDLVDVEIYKQEQIASKNDEVEAEKDNRYEILKKLMTKNNSK